MTFSRTAPALSSVIVALLAAAVLACTASAVSAWRVVKAGSSSGQFAVTAVNGTINRPKPKGIAVRLVGAGVSNGMAVVACSKGFSVASWSRTYRRAGLYVLPMTTGAGTCDVTASVGGSGKVIVQILALR